MFKFKKYFRKMKKDSGDTVLTGAIIMLPVIAMVFGLAVDTTKSIYASNVYTSKAQASVETAVKSINSRGSLHKGSVERFVDEYEIQSSSSESHTNEMASFENERCATAEVNGIERDLPYYEVKLGTVRGEKDAYRTATAKVENGTIISSNIKPNEKYRVIDADVYTSQPNIALGMFGMPCQVFKSSVSAIAFGDNEDLGDGPAKATSPTPGLLIPYAESRG